jgi:hypothetical protein
MPVRFVKRRSDVIELLLDSEIEGLLSQGDKVLSEWLYVTLREGVTGYVVYSNEDLRMQYNDCFDPLIRLDEVIDDLP